MNKSDHEIEFEWPGRLRFAARGWPAYIIIGSMTVFVTLVAQAQGLIKLW